MEEVEIKLSKEEYLSLVRILFFVDFLSFDDYITYLKRVDWEGNISGLLKKIYKLSDQLKITKDINLRSYPFTNEEFEMYKNFVKEEIKNIGRIFLAREFSKREDVSGGDSPAACEKYQFIKKKYLKEFKKNGIDNLRFKLFYKVTESEDEGDD